MRHVDIGIPANKGKRNIGCLFWLLARMVLQMPIAPGRKWDMMVDLFFYRDPEEEKENEEAEAVLPGPDYNAVADYRGMGAADHWGGAGADWNDAPVPALVPAAATWADWADPVEVKPNQTVKCELGEEKLLHLSMAALGESKKATDNVVIYATFNNQRRFLFVTLCCKDAEAAETERFVLMEESSIHQR